MFDWHKITKGRWQLNKQEEWGLLSKDDRHANKAWILGIPCQDGGFIYLFRENLDNPWKSILCYYTPRKRITVLSLYEELKHEKGVWIDTHIEGRETLFYFPVGLLPTVAEKMKAFRKRRLSPRTRQDLAKRFQKG